MGGIFGGGKSISTTDKVAAGMRFQTSAFGLAIPRAYGRVRLAGNLGDYIDFLAIAHTQTQQAGGKGGGQTMSHTSFTYRVALCLMLTEGEVPANAVKRIWKGKENYNPTPTSPGTGWPVWDDLWALLKGPGASQVEFFRGTTPQAAWGYMTSLHPERALGYPGTAYLAIPQFDLGDSPDLPQITVEMVGLFPYAEENPVTDFPANIPADTETTETHAVPAAPGPYTFTVDEIWDRAISATDITDPELPIPLTKVSGAPAAGEYAVDPATGEHTFNAAQAEASIEVVYGSSQPGQTFTIAPPYIDAFGSDSGIEWSGGGSLTKVASNPAADQYAMDAAGLYYFSHFDTTKAVKISYIELRYNNANPRDVLYDLFTAFTALRRDPAKLADLTSFSQICLAGDYLVSPVYEKQEDAKEIFGRLLTITNTLPVWDGGQLRLAPLGDAPLSAHGVSWTPDLAPVFDWSPEHFLVEEGKPPVRWLGSSAQDAYNEYSVEYVNRANDYAPDVETYRDQAAIDKYGLKKAPVIKLPEITNASLAQRTAQLLCNRAVYDRNSYEFNLSWHFARYIPGDVGYITDPGLGLNQLLVRIWERREDADGCYTFTVRPVKLGINSPAGYATAARQGFIPDYNADPGDANTPVIFQPPVALMTTEMEVWAAVSGGANWGGCNLWVSEDGDSYKYAGQILGKTRHGDLREALPASSTSPDTTHTLKVDLAISQGALSSGTENDATQLYTLCYVGGELLAYKTATPGGSYQYDCTWLVRGAYGTGMAEKPAGAPFVRLDQAVFKYACRRADIGKTIYLKLQSFNIYGRRPQDLSGLDPILYTIATPQTALTVTADISLDGSFETILVDASAQDVILTLRTSSQYQGQEYDIKRIDDAEVNGHLVTITTDGGGIDGQLEIYLTQQNESYHLECDDGVYHILAYVAGGVIDHLILNSSPADGHYDGLHFLAQAGEALAAGEECYLASDGKYHKAKADSESTMPVVAMAAAALSLNEAGFFLHLGFIRKDSWTAWTRGGLIYPSATTAGAITQTAPSGDGEQVQRTGYASEEKILFFLPDKTQMEV